MYAYHKGGSTIHIVSRYQELTQISIYYASIPEAAPGEELGEQMKVAYHHHTHSHHLEGVDQEEPSEKQTLFKAHHLKHPKKESPY